MKSKKTPHRSHNAYVAGSCSTYALPKTEVHIDIAGEGANLAKRELFEDRHFVLDVVLHSILVQMQICRTYKYLGGHIAVGASFGPAAASPTSRASWPAHPRLCACCGTYAKEWR